MYLKEKYSICRLGTIHSEADVLDHNPLGLERWLSSKEHLLLLSLDPSISKVWM